MSYLLEVVWMESIDFRQSLARLQTNWDSYEPGSEARQYIIAELFLTLKEVTKFTKEYQPKMIEGKICQIGSYYGTEDNYALQFLEQKARVLRCFIESLEYAGADLACAERLENLGSNLGLLTSSYTMAV